MTNEACFETHITLTGDVAEIGLIVILLIVTRRREITLSPADTAADGPLALLQTNANTSTEVRSTRTTLFLQLTVEFLDYLKSHS